MPDLFAYTDGACSGNPGPGGWGVLLLGSGDSDISWALGISVVVFFMVAMMILVMIFVAHY